MSISLLLDMAVTDDPDRVAVVCGETRLTSVELGKIADGGASVIAATGARHVAYVGVGGAALPLLLFASSRAAVAFTPLNYRLSAAALGELIDRLPGALVVADDNHCKSLIGLDVLVMSTDDFLTAAAEAAPASEFADPDSNAVVLFTSGTTSQPKAVELTHHNLTSYITGTVEFGMADREDAALICVPPYHIAGVSAALSNLYAGRKMVYLPNFDAKEWIELVQREAITTATVVPTMLDRIITALENDPVALPSLRTLAYGGSKVPLPLIRTALELLPDVGFVNAYGLTETSSTIAVLAPDDHRDALHSNDQNVKNRLASVGRPVPGIEVQIRAEDGTVLPPGETGELFVRGDQVSGRYTGIGSVLDSEGWFPTRDRAYLDADGYLFLGGRSDDTIIRGGENIAPAEIEDVLIDHPDVRQVAVVGIDDAGWGQITVAVVVPNGNGEPDSEDIREFVRARLRSSRTPDKVVFAQELPTNATGKLLRRDLVESLKSTAEKLEEIS